MVRKLKEDRKINTWLDDPDLDFDFGIGADDFDRQDDHDVIAEALQSMLYKVKNDLMTNKHDLIHNIIDNAPDDVLQELYDRIDEINSKLGDLQVFILNNAKVGRN